MLSMLYDELSIIVHVNCNPCSHKNKVTQWEHPLMGLDDKDTEGECVFVEHLKVLLL